MRSFSLPIKSQLKMQTPENPPPLCLKQIFTCILIFLFLPQVDFPSKYFRLKCNDFKMHRIVQHIFKCSNAQRVFLY